MLTLKEEEKCLLYEYNADEIFYYGSKMSEFYKGGG